MLILTRENYEKNKELFKPQYLIWDKSSNNFKIISDKDYSVEIIDVEKLSQQEKVFFTSIVGRWQREVFFMDIKQYNSCGDPRTIYTGICCNLYSYLNSFQKLAINNKDQNNYFVCCIKNKDLCLSIAIFSVSKSKVNKTAILGLSLAYPESQVIKEKRGDKVFGACGHNSRVAMINHIFLDESVKYIYSDPINNLAKIALEKLKFN